MSQNLVARPMKLKKFGKGVKIVPSGKLNFEKNRRERTLGFSVHLVVKMCKTSASGNQLSGMRIQLQASSIKDKPFILF